MLSEFPDDHVVAVCQVLAEHGVDFLIIGGVAARLHETGHATVDIDICPSRARANVARLAEALKALGAKLRAEGERDGVAFDPHVDLLERVSTLTLITRFGPLDLCFAPAGFDRGYDELLGGAVVVVVAGVSLPGRLPRRRHYVQASGRPAQGHRGPAGARGASQSAAALAPGLRLLRRRQISAGCSLASGAMTA